MNVFDYQYPSFTGFPEHMPFGEFRRRFDILAASQFRNTGPVLDEKKVSVILHFFAFFDRIDGSLITLSRGSRSLMQVKYLGMSVSYKI